MNVAGASRTRGSVSVAALVLLCVAYLAAPACVMKPPPGEEGSDDAGAGVSDGSGRSVGVNCGTDPSSGVTLCSGTSACEGLLLDADAFPGCGFRTVTPSFDLECVCNGTHLCPIGVAETCEDVVALFANRTPIDVCNQIGSGSCRELEGAAPVGTAGPASSCDRGCAADCVGSASCLELCGC